MDGLKGMNLNDWTENSENLKVQEGKHAKYSKAIVGLEYFHPEVHFCWIFSGMKFTALC